MNSDQNPQPSQLVVISPTGVDLNTHAPVPADACCSTSGSRSDATQSNKCRVIQVYDRPMCCSTGVCGPSVDPTLPRFAADLEWLKSLGHQVDRYNLAQQPLAFTQNEQIRQLLANYGTNCLPVVLIDGQVMSQSSYPARSQLAAWLDASSQSAPLPIVDAGACCSSGSCC